MNRAIKLALSDSFQELGGKDWLVGLGKSDPKTYALLLARLIPAEVNAELKAQVTHDLCDQLVQRIQPGRRRVHLLTKDNSAHKIIEAEVMRNN